MVYVVHHRVKGRVRLRVSTVKGRPDLAYELVQYLRAQTGVLSVDARPLTGSVLVKYGRPLSSWDDVVRLVEGAVGTIARCSTVQKDSPVKPSSAESTKTRTEALAQCRTASAPRRGPLERLASRLEALVHGRGDAWHSLTPRACLTRLNSTEEGLSNEEASARKALHGANEVMDAPGVSPWRLFAKQFMSLPVALLGAVSAVSLVTGGLLDAVIISGVVVANALVGFIMEKRSDEAISALRQLEEPNAQVIRSGRELSIPRRDLVPGDIMVLKAGSSIPADGRLLKADHLFVDESALSGESVPIEKSATVVLSEEVPVHDRNNMVYRGTVVTGGSGLAVVTATGENTQIGLLQRLLQTTEAPKAPIERQLDNLGRRLVWLCLGICALCFAIGLARGYGLLAMARLSLSLGAAAIPEGLSSAATATFALAVRRMRRRGVLIRNLTAVESLGAIQVLCVDKTGTLTENRMTVQEIVAGGVHYSVSKNRIFLDGRRIDPFTEKALGKILEIACLCSETKISKTSPKGIHQWDGSPTETALIDLALENGVPFPQIRDQFPRLWMCLRSESRPYMASLHGNGPNGALLTVKGSPEAVLASCESEIFEDERVMLTAQRRQEILEENERLSAKGLRVLGFAYGEGRRFEKNPGEGWVWCGLVGMADPIKPGAFETLQALRRAGIQVVMLTGDQEPTAMAVAQALDVSGGKPLRIVDASRFNGGSPAANSSFTTDEIHVFSRVSPSHKLQIVQMLQRSGKIVGMTGDGINDAPALKAADVGVCMGRKGTQVAQNVANVVLENDDLILIITALEEGRTIQNNIKKSVHFFLSSNLSEILVLSGALTAGLSPPLNAMQLLWINLISDILPGIALSMDPPEPDILERPPRKAYAPLFDQKDFTRMFREASVMAGASLLGAFYGLLRGGPTHAGTVAFHLLSSSQLTHALVCRHETKPRHGRSFATNPFLNGAILGSLLAQVSAGLFPGLKGFLRLTTMGLLDWIVVGLGTAATAWINSTLTRKDQPTALPSYEPSRSISKASGDEEKAHAPMVASASWALGEGVVGGWEARTDSK